MANQEKIEKLVNIEWGLFQKVNNEGGRASCQDDSETFFIMRKSYFEPLPEIVIDSVLRDFEVAQTQGRNLVSEKYAWMMKSASPDQFSQIESALIEPSVVAKTYLELIVVYQVEWMEELAGKYPTFMSHGRPIHTSEDTPYQTSFETYLRGELYTYSEETVRAYYKFVNEQKCKNINLIAITMENEGKAYGYANLQDAETKLKSGI